jgi:hypothetical protein
MRLAIGEANVLLGNLAAAQAARTRTGEGTTVDRAADVLTVAAGQGHISNALGRGPVIDGEIAGAALAHSRLDTGHKGPVTRDGFRYRGGSLRPVESDLPADAEALVLRSYTV